MSCPASSRRARPTSGTALRWCSSMACNADVHGSPGALARRLAVRSGALAPHGVEVDVLQWSGSARRPQGGSHTARVPTARPSARSRTAWPSAGRRSSPPPACSPAPVARRPRRSGRRQRNRRGDAGVAGGLQRRPLDVDQAARLVTVNPGAHDNRRQAGGRFDAHPPRAPCVRPADRRRRDDRPAPPRRRPTPACVGGHRHRSTVARGAHGVGGTMATPRRFRSGWWGTAASAESGSRESSAQ